MRERERRADVAALSALREVAASSAALVQASTYSVRIFGTMRRLVCESCLNS